MESSYERDKRVFQEILQEIPDSDPFSVLCALEKSKFSNNQLIVEYFKNIIESGKKRKEIKTIGLLYYKMDNGGVERVLSLLSEILSKNVNGKSYKIIIITDQKPSPDDFPLPQSVLRECIVSYKSCIGNYEQRGNDLRRLVHQYDIDVIIHSLWAESSVIWDLLTIKTCPNSPAFIVYTHTLFTYIWEQRKYLVKALWKVFSLADAIITLTDLDKKYWSIINKNTYKLYNPCTNNAKSVKNQWKESHHILWLGRISPEKQPYEVVSIMKYVAQALPNTVCHIVGCENKIVEEQLKNYINDNLLQENVIMEGFHTDVDKFYRMADIFISTSRYEGFPMTFMEAASYGIPTIIYDIPWIEYYNIIEGYSKVSQLDVKKASEEIIMLLSDKEEWETRSNQIFDSFQKFLSHDLRKDWDDIFDNYLNSIYPDKPSVDNDCIIGLNRLINIYDDAINNATDEDTTHIEMDLIYRSETWKIGHMIVHPLFILKNVFEKIRKKLRNSG